jgi:hypothetical protein
MVKDALQVWQQQPGEPPLWYSRFHRFLLMGARRSLLATYNAECSAGKGAKKGSVAKNSSSTISRVVLRVFQHY